MTDVLLDGRVILVPPGWTIRVTLERLADQAHPVTTRGGDAGYSHRGVAREPHDGGARPPGTGHEPSIDELDPLPTMRRRDGSAPTPVTRPVAREGFNLKTCPGCARRCGTRTRTCPGCGHRFQAKARS